MKRFFLLFAVGAFLAPSFAQTDPFAFSFFEQMQRQSDQNVLVSPLSIKQAVGMAANNALDETLTEILSLSGDESLAALNQRNRHEAELALAHHTDTLSALNMANSVWYNPAAISLSQAYQDSLVAAYAAEMRTVDFGTQQGVDSLNAWVSRRTCGMIPQLMQEPDPFRWLSLINAVYFRGKWLNDMMPFGQRAFRNADGSGTNVEMMQYLDEYGNLFYHDDFVGFGKSFIGSHDIDYSMFFVMPRDPEHIPVLTESVYHELLSNSMRVALSVKMPKFDIGCSADILPVLRDMGAFLHDQYADLPRVSAINHITRLKVDEKGAEAAAVTDICIEAGIGEDTPPVEIVLDRPFYVFISDRHMADPLFMGRVSYIQGPSCQAPVVEVFSGLQDVSLSAPEKLVRDGRLIIRKGGKEYSATGQLLR